LEDERKETQEEMVYFGKSVALSDTYILKRKMINRKCLIRRGAPWLNFIIKLKHTHLYNNTTPL